MRSNLGVGDFDLPSRAYEREQREAQLRTSLTGLIAPKIAHELKVQYRDTRTQTVSENPDTAVIVIDAFSAGGAGQNGDRKLRELDLEDNIEFSPAKKHNMRVGVQLESFWVNSLERQNFNGTFTFASNAAYDGGTAEHLPAAHRHGPRRVLPVAGRLVRAGRLDDPQDVLAQPRPAARVPVAPRRHDRLRTARRRDVDAREVHGSRRVGHLQRLVRDEPLRADAARQRHHAAGHGRPEPGYPDPFAGAFATVLPPSIIRSSENLAMPWMHQASIGVERNFGALRVQTNYFMQRGYDQFRSLNINAPVNGLRPDPEAGNITQLESTGQSDTDRWMLNVNYAKPERRLFLGANYQLARVYNFVDSRVLAAGEQLRPRGGVGPVLERRPPPAVQLPVVPAAEEAPRQPHDAGAVGVAVHDHHGHRQQPRHRAERSPRGRRPQQRARIRDVEHERASEPQLQLRPATPDRRRPGGGGPIRVRGGGPGGPGGPGGGGGGGGPMMMMMDQGSGRYNVEFYAQALNVLNRTNFQNYAGSLRSPYFGEPTSAGPARRIEVGINFGF